jgi:5-dehydro-2-deoxygluconokinase
VQISGHELLIEVVPPKGFQLRQTCLLRAMKRLLQPRASIRSGGSCRRPRRPEWIAIDALIAERDPYCRGVVLLGLNAPIEALARGFADARGEQDRAVGLPSDAPSFTSPRAPWLAGTSDDAGLVVRCAARISKH